jgi:NhaP-type Na+/H+ or K+/H+ antiporter
MGEPGQGEEQVSRYLTIDLPPPTMTFALWTLVIGVLLITMVLSGTLLNRLPMSNAMLYLAAGLALGPAGWAGVMLNPLTHAPFLERVAEVAVLISLFSVGLKLGLPLSNRDWLMVSFPCSPRAWPCGG